MCISRPAECQLLPEAITRASAYSERTGGTAVLVMQDDKIIFEEYQNGANPQTATHIHSATKAFWAAVAALALEDGLISSYDEPVANTITEWQDGGIHPGKKLITIRQLLSLSSGLSQDVEFIQGNDPKATDIFQYVVDSLRLVSFPGQLFSYGPSNYYAFGVLLQRKLQAKGLDPDPLHYLVQRILQPIGLTYESWLRDPSGNPHIPNGCYILPREWIKFGRLLLQKGYWEGQQIIDSSLVGNLFLADGPNPGHGKFIWLNRTEGYGATKAMTAPPGSPGGFIYHDGANDIVGAMGAGKNRMYILPSDHAVVLRQTLSENDDFDDHTFLSLLLDRTTATVQRAHSPQLFSVYPTLATDEITIIAGNDLPAGITDMRLFNTLGVEVKRMQIAAGTVLRLAVHDLPRGAYFLISGMQIRRFIHW